MNESQKKQIEQTYGAGKKYYRAKDVAEYLGIGISTVWMYSSQGKLKPKKLSARVTVFDIRDVEKLFDGVEV